MTSLKHKLKKVAENNDIPSMIVHQCYVMERFLERVSVSEYNKFFVIKGGFLISSIIGINARTTMDIDATIKGYPMLQNKLRIMIESIIGFDLGDDVMFDFCGIEEIRESDEYEGFRVSLIGKYGGMKTPLKIDLTTGDQITPRVIEYGHKLLLEDRIIQLFSYNLETLLAEKLETVISRGDQNTRLRDYYDIFILFKLCQNNIDFQTLKIAIENTTEKRGTSNRIKEYETIINTVAVSFEMLNRWKKYQLSVKYAEEIDFQKTCEVVKLIMRVLQE